LAPEATTSSRSLRFGAAGEEQDGAAVATGAIPQPAAELEAVDAGQPPVQHGEVEPAALERRPGRLTVLERGHDVAAPFQETDHDRADARVVLDDDGLHR
jgi:hypothetical protein